MNKMVIGIRYRIFSAISCLTDAWAAARAAASSRAIFLPQHPGFSWQGHRTYGNIRSHVERCYSAGSLERGKITKRRQASDVGNRPLAAHPRQAISGWSSALDAEQFPRVRLQHFRPDFLADVELGEIGKPAVRRDHRPIGAEQHLVLQDRVDIAHQDRWKIFRRPAGEVDIDIRFVGCDRKRFLLPGKGWMGEND